MSKSSMILPGAVQNVWHMHLYSCCTTPQCTVCYSCFKQNSQTATIVVHPNNCSCLLTSPTLKQIHCSTLNRQHYHECFAETYTATPQPPLQQIQSRNMLRYVTLQSPPRQAWRLHPLRANVPLKIKHTALLPDVADVRISSVCMRVDTLRLPTITNTQAQAAEMLFIPQTCI